MLIEMCHVVWFSPDLFIAVIYLSIHQWKTTRCLNNFDSPYVEYILFHSYNDSQSVIVA